MRAIVTLLAMLFLSGCVSTAASIITAPVRAVGRVADLATTSQSESDENRGRALREREEQIGRLDRQRQRATEKCDDGDRDACSDVARIEAQIEDLQGAPTPR
ncbi:MAG: hypothetical protein AABZ45_02295 [Pseudomonadota bacterium]